MTGTIRIAASAEKDPDFDSSVIMSATGKPYSHVLAIIPVNGIDLIFHAGGDPVSFERLDRFLETHVLTHDFHLITEMSEDEIWDHMTKRLGIPYSKRQLYAHGLPDEFRSDVTKPINGDQEVICSEEMAILINFCFPSRRVFNWDPDHLRPEHIVSACEFLSRSSPVG
jgi:hypothetical protein